MKEMAGENMKKPINAEMAANKAEKANMNKIISQKMIMWRQLSESK